ncbi:MAG: glycosyltransferase [Lachnospiraceae bacterium]|jgi:glycosyltransferase involved in cell wall biosynthesis|nr:glycosyltransferase [Lachnospiraceae bacterium]
MITVLTPTYNRQMKLLDLYQSLCQQTVKDFEWLIVDDGSTDDTESEVSRFILEADFSIRYIYKENGGKHTALNVGIAINERELTFIVDSDDRLKEDAIEIIIDSHSQHSDNESLCGYVFLRCFPDGKLNGKQFVRDDYIASYIDTRINSNDTCADKAEVFLTKCLKEFPFPEYPGERFLGEDIVWIRMAMKYKMVHINKVIYIGDYLADGLTKNRRKHNIAAPLGCMYRAEEYMRNELKLRYRLKGALQYVIYGKFAGFKLSSLIRKTSYKTLVLIVCLPGSLLYHKWG